MADPGPLPGDLLRERILGIGECNPVRGAARPLAQGIACHGRQAVEPGEFGEQQIPPGKCRGQLVEIGTEALFCPQMRQVVGELRYCMGELAQENYPHRLS